MRKCFKTFENWISCKIPNSSPATVIGIFFYMVNAPAKIIINYSITLSPFSGRHNTNTNTNIHGRPIRPGIRTLPTSRWCRKSVALPSTTLPSAPERHTHTSMARRRFLPWKKSSPFGEIRTHLRRAATSEHCLRQPCGHRAT
jgi:hypothetical protein